MICALSGGVDSAVAAALVHRAIGDQLTCIFVDNGLLRASEPERVVATFGTHLEHATSRYVDAADAFLDALRGVTDPEEKRSIIGDEFIASSPRRPASSGTIDFLAQGTLYPDVIESTAPTRTAAAKIKTHHNVGGLPDGPAVPADRAAALPVQGRGARGRRWSSGCPRRWSGGSRSRVPAWRSASWAR